jgi:hypothetical protein
MNYPSVKEASPTNDYQINIQFDNGECGILDMKPYLSFGVFRQINKPEVFSKIKVAFDTIEWETGVDLDPEFVYRKCSLSECQN